MAHALQLRIAEVKCANDLEKNMGGIMESRKLNLKILLVIVLGLGFVLSGCSRSFDADSDRSADLGINSPAEEGTEIPQFSLTRHQYPEAANYPPTGYEFLQLGICSALRVTNGPYDDEWVAVVINKSQGGELWLMDCVSGIIIEPWGMPKSGWIALTIPTEDEPWIEFEPHGLVFNYSQVARISWAECGLPEGVQPEDLTVWYYHEEIDEYEYIGGTIYPELEYIEYPIDHFSRYVIAYQP